jgi:hypothetical protein
MGIPKHSSLPSFLFLELLCKVVIWIALVSSMLGLTSARHATTVIRVVADTWWILAIHVIPVLGFREGG